MIDDPDAFGAESKQRIKELEFEYQTMQWQTGPLPIEGYYLFVKIGDDVPFLQKVWQYELKYKRTDGLMWMGPILTLKREEK